MGSTEDTRPTFKKKTKVTREAGDAGLERTNYNADEKESFLKSTRRFFNRKGRTLPTKLKNSPYGDTEEVIKKSPDLRRKVNLKLSRAKKAKDEVEKDEEVEYRYVHKDDEVERVGKDELVDEQQDPVIT